jgi:hypothetical protein
VVDNDGRPLDGEQWISVGARNTLDEFSGRAWGYEWVRYRGTSRPLTAAHGHPIRYAQEQAGAWQQAITSTSVTRHNPSRSVRYARGRPHLDCRAAVVPQNDNFKLLVEIASTDPMGWAASVQPEWLRRLKGALVGICGQGRVVRVDLEGSIETLLGPRLRRGRAAPILAAPPSSAQWAWIESF